MQKLHHLVDCSCFMDISGKEQEFFDDCFLMGLKEMIKKWEMKREEIEEQFLKLQSDGMKPTKQPEQQQEPEAGEQRKNKLLDGILETLRKDEDVRRELYKRLKKEIGIDVTPYIDNFLKTKTNEKYMTTALMKEPALEIAKTVLDMYDDDGYDMYQISEQMHLKIAVVKDMISKRDHWKKMIAKKIMASPEIKELPWYIRAGMKIKGWFGR